MIGVVPSKSAAAQLLDGGGVAEAEVDIFRVCVPDETGTGRVSLHPAFIGTAA